MEAKEQIQSLKNLVIRQDNKIYSLQEELSISNTQREGYKEELEYQRKLVLELQEKNRELKESNEHWHLEAKVAWRQVKSLEYKNNNQSETIKGYQRVNESVGNHTGISIGLLEKVNEFKAKIKEQGEEIVNLREGIKFFLEGFIEFVETEPEVYQRKKAQMDAVKKGFESIKDQWINDNI